MPLVPPTGCCTQKPSPSSALTEAFSASCSRVGYRPQGMAHETLNRQQGGTCCRRSARGGISTGKPRIARRLLLATSWAASAARVALASGSGTQVRLAAQLALRLFRDGTMVQMEPSGPGAVRFRASVALQVWERGRPGETGAGGGRVCSTAAWPGAAGSAAECAGPQQEAAPQDTWPSLEQLGGGEVGGLVGTHVPLRVLMSAGEEARSRQRKRFKGRPQQPCPCCICPGAQPARQQSHQMCMLARPRSRCCLPPPPAWGSPR